MKKIYKLSIASLFVVLVIPSIALASWWNPFSWLWSWNHKTTAIQTAQEIKPLNSLGSALISSFLENPTIENFIQTCILSKNIEGNTSKWVLDDNRENMISVRQSLYYDEGMADCRKIDKENGGGYLLPIDNSSLVEFKNSDTDEQRKAKIDFNNKIKNLISTTKMKFVIFSADFYHDIVKPSPAEWFEENWPDYSFKLVELGGYFK